jgi:hypothetical protein
MNKTNNLATEVAAILSFIFIISFFALLVSIALYVFFPCTTTIVAFLACVKFFMAFGVAAIATSAI